MTKPKADGREYGDVHFRTRDENTLKFLKFLKRFHINMNKFVQEAVDYYLPIYKDKINYATKKRYEKVTEKEERWDKK